MHCELKTRAVAFASLLQELLLRGCHGHSILKWKPRK